MTGFEDPPVPTAYCGECGWQHRADEGSSVDLNRAMIDHHVETGHSPIEQRRPDALEALEEADRSPAVGRIDHE